MFKRPGTYRPAHELPAPARLVRGNDNGYLPVPGLISLVAIFMGDTELELNRIMEIPQDADGKKTREVTVPLVLLDKDNDLGPILLRSELSNDGIWQSSQEFTICGEWEGDEPPVYSQEALEAMSHQQVMEHASALGIGLRPVGTSKQAAIEAIMLKYTTGDESQQ